MTSVGFCGAVSSSSNTSDHYDRDVYNEYQQMVHQQKYHQQQLQQAQQLQGGHNNVNNLPRFSNQDIAAAVMDSGLLPMNNESGLYGNQQIGSASGHQHHNQHQYGQHLQQQQQQQFSGYNNQLGKFKMETLFVVEEPPLAEIGGRRKKHEIRWAASKTKVPSALTQGASHFF